MLNTKIPAPMYSLARPGAAAIVFPLLAIAASLIGFMGILQDSSQLPAFLSRINLPLLFGLVLFTSVGVQFDWRLRHAALRSASAIQAYVRRVSRQVYLLMYLLAAFKELHCVFESTAPGVGPGIADVMTGFQGYLACGCAALVGIRIMAAWCRYRLTGQAA